MESQRANPPGSAPSTKDIQLQAQLYTLLSELGELKGQRWNEIATALFLGLVGVTGASSGRLFLTDNRGSPDFGLLLLNGQLDYFDETSVPPLEEQGLAVRSFEQRQALLLHDLASDPHWPTWSHYPETRDGGSALAFPLITLAGPLGALVLVAPHPGHFSPTHIDLIRRTVDYAAFLLENTRLKTVLLLQQRTIQALQQTAHTLSVPLNLEQSLRAVLIQMTHALPYPHGMALLWEDGRVRPVAAAGLEACGVPFDRAFTRSELPSVFRALEQTESLTDESKDLPGDLQVLGFVPAPKSWLIAPLIARREALGAVVLASPHASIHRTGLMPAIDAFVDHASMAIAYHRLKKATDRRLRELAFLNESGQAITSTLNLERILHLLLERVRNLLQIDAASIALRDEQTGELVFEAASGEGADKVLGFRLQPGQGIAGWVAETAKPLVVPDVHSDARFYAEVDGKTGIKTQSILCIPIVLKGKVVGVIEALNPGKVPFDEQAVELLNALAGLAATAIDNARLFARVQSAETRYAGLFEDSASPIIITDMKGTIVDVNRNACTLLGKTKEELSGLNLLQAYNFTEAYEQIRAGAEAVFETQIGREGQLSTIEIKAKQIQVNNVRLIQWIGRDISAEIELEQTRADMVRMIVHDLRNPLANIMNSLEMLYDVIRENDEAVSLEELVVIAKRSGQRMHQLISSILDISRLETGQAILDSRPNELAPLLQDAIEFVNPQTDIRDIQVITGYEPDLPLVAIDSDMISRVVLNLLDNAIKFTSLGGTITVTARRVGSEVEVAVADNGVGIPTDQLQWIFEKFTRVRHKDGPQGTGLGLAFCQLAVKSHGGRIWAESILDKGSTFRFTLPVYRSGPAD